MAAEAALETPGGEVPVTGEPLTARRVVDGVEVLGSLSPSRAGDFLTCPLLFRFRTVDRLPEPVSLDALRGTVVHAVLERLFDAPPAERTPDYAVSLVPQVWAELAEAAPDLREAFPLDEAVDRWLLTCSDAVRAYFRLEDPTRLEPAEREAYVETLLESRLLLRGIIDRIDVAPDGSVRVVDYKTGRAPGIGYEAAAMFQLRFYALVLWRERGVVPAALHLVYIGSGEVLRYEPDADDLLATERKVEAVWTAIREAAEAREWLPNRSRLCGWCAHRDICPAWGGVAPELPESTGAPGTGAESGGGVGGLAPNVRGGASK